jgi:adenylate cyclase
MPQHFEIERKFLVVADGWQTAAPQRLTQVYLSRRPGCTVRLRQADDRFWLTIKGPSQAGARIEIEHEVSAAEARLMWGLAEGVPVEKLRHRVEWLGVMWEVDQFMGANGGLLLAEVELEAADEAVCLPPWVGAEVTDDFRFSNSYLSEHPYSGWGSTTENS